MGGQYVGIDLHRRRSVIYMMNADGEKVECVRIANPWVLLEEVAKAGLDAEVPTGVTKCTPKPASRNRSTAQYQPYVA